MLSWRQIGCQLIDPLALFHKLTFGTMSVSTGVIGLRSVPALIALVAVPTQFCCAALGDGGVGFSLYGAKLITGGKQLFVLAENIRQFHRVFLIVLHGRDVLEVHIIQRGFDSCHLEFGYMEVDRGSLKGVVAEQLLDDA